MADEEAEAWAEELKALVDQEEDRSEEKLHQMTQGLNKDTDPFPQSMGPRVPSELFKNLPNSI